MIKKQREKNPEGTRPKGSKLEFEQLEFYPQVYNDIINDDKNDHNSESSNIMKSRIIKVIFLKHYYFMFDVKDTKLKNLKFDKNSISAQESEKSLNASFGKVLKKGFDNLANSVTGRRTIYIHKNSGIPLIGTNIFGIVDRNTNCIEVKPLTGCNLNCIYCSVDEGNANETRKTHDFLVEKDYLVEELRKLIASKHKSENGLEVHIGPQGEPLLYPELVDLVRDMAKIDGVKRISMDTNGLLLNERNVAALVEAGLTRFNISLNSMDKILCDKISNRNYNLKHLINIVNHIDKEYASKGKCEIIIAPVLLSGMNDSELDALIEFAKKQSGLKNSIKIGIQNFLYYQNGRNPVKQKGWDEFYELLRSLEIKHNTKLVLDAGDFLIEKNDTIRKPFRKGEIVRAEIMCNGAYDDEKIAVLNQRCITVHDCSLEKGYAKIKIVRDKHNVFDGVPVN